MKLDTSKISIVRPDKLQKILNSTRVENLFSLAELTQLTSFRSERRITNWLAGRLAAKQLLSDYLKNSQNIALQYNEIEIYNEVSGAPAFRILRDMPPIDEINISISHSHSFGFCALAKTREIGWIGADIEVIRPLSEGIERKLLHKEEMPKLKEIQPHLLSMYLIAHLAVKEAAFKSLRTDQSIPLREVRIAFGNSSDASVYINNPKIQLEAGFWEWYDCLIALAINHTPILSAIPK